MRKIKNIIALVICTVLSVLVLASCSFKSKSSPSTFEVEFIVENANYETTKVNSGEKVSRPSDPKKTGYSFDNWYTTDSFTVEFDFNQAITSNKKVYGKLVQDIIDDGDTETYTVSFNTNGGSTVASQIVNKNNKATMPTAPTKTDFVFGGWYTTSACTTEFDFNTPITADTTVYAKWNEPAKTKYTITFNTLGGSTISSVEVEEGAKLAAPSQPTKANATFGGWYTNSGCTTAYNFNNTVTNSFTLYAKWTAQESTGDLAVSKSAGYTEGIYAVFAETNAANANVQYSLDGTTFKAVDKELIRQQDASNARVDIVGLAAGNYTIKITNSANKSKTISNIAVTEEDRSGYAHFGATEGVGAYNNDGTLKTNADIIYVTEATKNTVTWTYDGATYTGISAILQNQNKSNKPMVVRIIGTIGAATWKQINNANYSSTADSLAALLKEYKKDTSAGGSTITSDEKADILAKAAVLDTKVKGLNGQYVTCMNFLNNNLSGGQYTEQEIISNGWNELDTSKYSKLNGLTNKIKFDASKFEFDSYYNMLDINNAHNVTVEGIGTDATLDQWGFTFKDSSAINTRLQSVEVRNLTFNNYTEDACSFEGTGSDDALTSISVFGSKRFWVHNNTFNIGINYFDVCSEQDKHDGDGCTDFKRVAYVTVSFNHYAGTHKTGLVGGGDTQKDCNFTFHHNWYERCQARLPFARQANMHMYNNFYDSSTGNNMQIYAGAYAFIESCYFKNCSSTFTFSNSDGKVAAVKSYLNTYDNCSKTNGATIVTDRTAAVTNGNLYGQTFDTNSAIFYYANGQSDVMLLETAQEAVETVKLYAGVLKEDANGGPIAPTETYEVTYVTNNGTSVPKASVKSGRSLPLPTVEKEGYYLEGWYSEAAFTNKVTASTKVTSNMTVYAKWQEKKVASYTTLYDMTGKTETISTTAPTTGWYYQTNSEGDPTSAISSTLSSGKLTVTDTSDTQTNCTIYNVGDMTTGSIKITGTAKILTAAAKWSFFQVLDDSTGIAIRANASKYLTLTNDGSSNDGQAFNSTALANGNTVSFVMEIDIDAGIITATIGDKTLTVNKEISKITGIQFMTAKSAANRSFEVNSLKIEVSR